MSAASAALYTVGGREEPFSDEESRHIATIHVVLSHRPPRAYPDDGSGLKCVAERAAYAAAAAYNFHDTRIVRVDLLSIEKVEADDADE